MTLLKKQTVEARKITNNKYFKFDEEDNVIDFDKRRYLGDQPESKLKQICKSYGIMYHRKWVRWSNISQILNHSQVNKIIIELIAIDKSVQITQEDLDYLEKEHYRNSSIA